VHEIPSNLNSTPYHDTTILAKIMKGGSGGTELLHGGQFFDRTYNTHNTIVRTESTSARRLSVIIVPSRARFEMYAVT
jgi:hypothetical protein